MVCTKCGFDCGNSKYCSKCGTKLVKECRKCGAPLSDEDLFCPKCGADNSEKACCSGWEIAGLVSFIATLVLAGMKFFAFFTIRGTFRFFFNHYFYNIPFLALAGIYAVFALAVIIFSCIYRKKGSKGFGITAIVCAAILKVGCLYSPSVLLILIGTIVHYIAVLKKKKG